jgi:diacylglycerol O-acyltransferase / wax synthase
VAFAPVSIAINGLGLNVTGFSYHGTMWVCAVACREMMPDPGFFADCMRGAFNELVAAADALAATPAAQAPVQTTKRKAARADAPVKRARKQSSVAPVRAKQSTPAAPRATKASRQRR